MAKERNRKAFTIVELVIVIAVIAILATILVPTFGNVINNAKDSAAKQEAKNAYTEYMIEHAADGTSTEYMIWDADGSWVALHNGAAVGVYESEEDALKAMLPTADSSLLFSVDRKLWIYGIAVDSANPFLGKKISILGDSISTYTGVSNNSEYNSTLAGGKIFYTSGKYGVYQQDTWWQQVLDICGMELCVNNSWSGSAILNERNGTVGAYIDRCVQLHNTAGDVPDVIFVYLGTNDFSDHMNDNQILGSFSSIDYDTLITQSGDGYHYATPASVCEAYAIMLHKMHIRYPEADIYCFSLLARKSGVQPEAFNADLAQIAEKAGCNVVDLYSLLTSSNFSQNMGDKLHPNPVGMDAISREVIRAMAGEKTAIYDVAWSLNGVSVDNASNITFGGNGLTVRLTAQEGYRVSEVSVVMGGRDVTASCYADGVICIDHVTGDIQINATAVLAPEEPENFYWQFKDGQLISVTDSDHSYNPLTMTQGSITDGNFSKVKYTLNKPIVLKHDQPWVIEWKSKGSWTDTTDGALLFAGAPNSATSDKPYLYRRHKSDFIALGVYTGGKYHNYGVSLSSRGIDGTAEHVYLLVNRILEDGSNMIYLHVDNQEIGAMNHHWIGGTDQKETVDWVNGQDFIFTNMGTSPHTIGNCYIDYIRVEESH